MVHWLTWLGKLHGKRFYMFALMRALVCVRVDLMCVSVCIALNVLPDKRSSMVSSRSFIRATTHDRVCTLYSDSILGFSSCHTCAYKGITTFCSINWAVLC